VPVIVKDVLPALPLYVPVIAPLFASSDNPPGSDPTVTLYA
jgi:hypothetical protein